MYSKTFIGYTILVCLACNSNNTYSGKVKVTDAGTTSKTSADTNPYRTISEIPLPRGGFARIKKEENSFADFLLNTKLKKDKTVYKFDRMPKANQTAQFAVLDISVGDRDLQQCADAIMRLRAEYLFAVKKYQDIHFSDNAGKVYQFKEPYTGKNLQAYLQRVFGMCGTASLSKQLKSISFKNIEPGDVIIRGGFPGHAVIIMDVAINKDGTKAYLLAQSYMPAQDIHVLLNPADKILSPWYMVSDNEDIATPEYNFTKKELKRW